MSTPRINVTYNDETTVTLIERAADLVGQSRSAFIIEAAHKAATQIIEEYEGVYHCEVCNGRIDGQPESWSKQKKSGLGETLCIDCCTAVDLLPEDTALRVLKGSK